MFGTGGGLIEIKAALLASHGFAALALAYFAYDDLPKSIDDIDFEYFEEAVEWMAQLPQTSPDGLGVLSVSAGSQFSLMLAIHKSDLIKAVVPISSLDYFIYPFKMRKERITPIELDKDSIHISEDGTFMFKDFFTIGSKTLQDNPGIIPVEKIHCPVLFIYGEDDLDIPAECMSKRMVERMGKHGRGSLCSVLGYPGAGHLIEPPYTPHCDVSLHRLGELGVQCVSWGGETKAHAHAQEHSWPRIVQFFRKHLGRNQMSHL